MWNNLEEDSCSAGSRIFARLWFGTGGTIN